MRKVIFLLLAVLFAASLAEAASFNVAKNRSVIDTQYFEGDFVTGIVDVSFDKQDNLALSSNFEGKEIDLIDFLKDKMNYTAGKDFSCNPLSCKSYYLAHTPETDKEIRISKQKDLYGFKIKESRKIVRINDLSFSVDANVAQVTCSNPFSLDLFDDGEIDAYDSEIYSSGDCGDFFGGKDQGCFDADDVTRSVKIGSDRSYCERIEDIPPAPGYRVGANVAVNSAGGSLGFAMFPVEGDCEPLKFTWSGPVQNSGEVSVVLNYSSSEKFDALVCVYTKPEFEDSFSIDINENSGSCGLSYEACDSVTNSSFEADYDLFLVPMGYAPLGQINFNSESYEEFTGRNLKNDLNSYLNSTYDNNCSGTDGCVIPFSLFGVGNDNQRIHSASLKYSVSAFDSEINEISDLNEKPAKVSSNYLQLDVGRMNFKVPETNGKKVFRLLLGNSELISENIFVDIGFYFQLTPRFAFLGRETSFTAQTSSQIVSSKWDFGDGTSPVIVSGNSAKHAYSASGSYPVRVSLVKSGAGQQNSTKRFTVLVGDAKESANITLKDYETRVSNLKNSIATFPEWVRSALVAAIDLNTKETLVKNKRQDYNLLGSSAPDSSYVAIVNEVAALDLPYSIFVKTSGTLPAFIGLNNIDIKPLEEISRNNADSAEDAKMRIAAWMDENYGLDIGFEEITARGEDADSTLAMKYKLTITKKSGAQPNSAYLIIGYPKQYLVFNGGGAEFSEAGTSGATYLDLNANPTTEVEFLITGSNAPDVGNLGAYIAPSISDLGASGKPIVECWRGICDENGKINWWKLGIGLAILLVLFLAVYLILQTWYKRNYERYLFKDPNDLYNVLNFIYNSRKNGLKDKEIRESLLQKRWTKEQVTYAFRKLEGKRTGMWEIPIFKFVENRKVRAELQKKQGSKPIDIRFIKHPNL